MRVGCANLVTLLVGIRGPVRRGGRAAEGSRGASAALIGRVAAVWWSELEGAVRPMLVVLVRVHAQDSFEMSACEDEDAIEAVAADGPHPALSERVRVRRSNRRPDHLDPLGAEDLVKGATELRVAIVDQHPELRLMLAQLHGEVASLLGDPDALRVGCAGDEIEPAGRERDEEEDVDPPQRERLDS